MGLFDFLKKNKGEDTVSTPQNNAELWVRDLYVIWSEYCGGSYKYIGGYEHNRKNASMARGVLNRDWLVNNKDSMIDMVDYILKDENADDSTKLAFDYGCGANICARCYLGGLITREEMMAKSAEIAAAVKAHFSSWEAFAKSYIIGAANETGNENKAVFEEIYNRLSSMADGPYKTDWDTPIK